MKIEKIVVASHNQGKIKEIGEMLEPLNIAVVSAAELKLPDVEETGATFEENARLKADALSKLCGLPCLADDSGLCVDALGGRPGVYSARYAPNRDFDKGMEMLLGELAAKNLQMNEKLTHMAQRTTREKLLAYLSAQARRAGSASFRIPFDRQQLADFLSVNRSAMSAELSRMQREGLLCADRSSFTLRQPE